MDRKTNRMVGRTATIDNNSNNSKSIAICDSNSSAGAYNNSLASIMRNINNSKSTAACGSNEATKTRNNNPMNIIHSSSRSYSSHIRNG